MRHSLLFFVVIAAALVCGGAAVAQDAPAEAAAAPTAAAPAPSAAPAPAAPAPGAPALGAPVAAPVPGTPGAPAPGAPAAPAPKGDVVKFKSGRTLENVQVVRQTPLAYEIEVSPGVTMLVPKKQVESITYDKIEPGERRAPNAGPLGPRETNLIPGSKIKPELFEKMTAPIPDPLPKSEKQDLVIVLGDLEKRLGVPVVIDDAVKQWPPAQRMWAVDAKPGATLTTLLDDLSMKLPNLAVVRRYGDILVTTKEKAGAMPAPPLAAGQPPVAVPPPPVPPPPPPVPPAAPAADAAAPAPAAAPAQ